MIKIVDIKIINFDMLEFYGISISRISNKIPKTPHPRAINLIILE